MIFTGYVIDENEKGVPDAEVFIKSDNAIFYRACSDSSGFIYIPYVKKGHYSVSIKENNFASYNERIIFSGLSDIFCFRLKSADLVFDEVQTDILKKNYSGALEKLDDLVCEKRSGMSSLVSFYKSRIQEVNYE